MKYFRLIQLYQCDSTEKTQVDSITLESLNNNNRATDMRERPNRDRHL